MSHPSIGTQNYPTRALPPCLCSPPYSQASVPENTWSEEGRDGTDSPYSTRSGWASGRDSSWGPWGQGGFLGGVALWSFSRMPSLPLLWVAPASLSQTGGPQVGPSHHPILFQNNLSMPSLAYIPSMAPYCSYLISAPGLDLSSPNAPQAFTSLLSNPFAQDVLSAGHTLAFS